MQHRLILVLAMCICLLALTPSFAAIPPNTTVQGRLTDDLGNPVADGLHSINFRIYGSEAGADLMWESGFQDVLITGGLFTYELGSATPIPENVFVTGVECYLGVTVAPEPEMTPRVHLTSGPFTFQAAHADIADWATTIADDAVTSAKIADGTVLLTDLAQSGADSGQVIKWNGGAWMAQADESSGGAGWNWSDSSSHGPDSVLYADSAGIAGSASSATYADSAGALTDGAVDLVDIAQNGAGSNQVIKWNGSVWVAADDETGGASAWTDGGPIVTLNNELDTVVIGNVPSLEKLNVGGGVRILGDITATGNGSFSGGLATGANSFAAGSNNEANGTGSATPGGAANNAFGDYSVIGGGKNNRARGEFSVVAGGGGDGQVDSNSAPGDWSVISGGLRNIALGEYSAIGGGMGNIDSSLFATISGGALNTARGPYASIGGGSSNNADGDGSTIAGGYSNAAGGSKAAIGGGYSNRTNGDRATIAGGNFNLAAGYVATVGGGSGDSASAPYSTIAGGRSNLAADTGAFIGGGGHNRARGRYSVVAGGGGSSPSDSNLARMEWSTVSGGRHNVAANDYTTISGGWDNLAEGHAATVSGGRSDTAYGYASVVGGGDGNYAGGSHSTIAGGDRNRTLQGSDNSTIAGGSSNTIVGWNSFIGSGLRNDVQAEMSSIGSGLDNRINGGFSSIGSGYADTVNGKYSCIPGGLKNLVTGDYSLAAGRRAKAKHDGTFVWADDTDADFASTDAGQFLIRAADGVGINTTNPIANLHIASSTSYPGIYISGTARDLTWPSDQVFQLGTLNGTTFSEKARIESDGDFGIGTTSISARLDVPAGFGRRAAEFRNDYSSAGIGTSAATVTVENSNASGIAFFAKSHSSDAAAVFSNNSTGHILKCFGASNFVMVAKANGRVGIGTSSPNYTLDVRGTIGNNSTTHHSDRRWKKNINSLSRPLDIVRKLRGVSFEWRTDEFEEMNFPDGKRIGLIAQEVEDVLPELVSTNDDGYKSVEYANLVAVLIEAVKAQQEQIDDLKSTNESLSTRLTRLEKEL